VTNEGNKLVEGKGGRDVFVTTTTQTVPHLAVHSLEY